MDENGSKGNLWQGFLLAGGVNVGALLVAIITIPLGVGAVLLAGFGLLQFIWIGIMFAKYKARGRIETAKGFLLAAGITLLLSAACWKSLSAMPFH